MGAPTVFLRTTVCNLRCAWCDSEFSFTEGDYIRLDALMEKIRSFPAQRVCLTGGEPLLQKQSFTLCERLLAAGFHVVVETGGSISIRGLPKHQNLSVSLDVKCPSSKMEARMDWDNLKALAPGDQLKFVIAGRADYDYARDVLRRHEIPCPVIFQPESGTKLLPLADWILADGLDVRLLPQLHKLIWGDRRGV